MGIDMFLREDFLNAPLRIEDFDASIASKQKNKKVNLELHSEAICWCREVLQ